MRAPGPTPEQTLIAQTRRRVVAACASAPVVAAALVAATPSHADSKPEPVALNLGDTSWEQRDIAQAARAARHARAVPPAAVAVPDLAVPVTVPQPRPGRHRAPAHAAPAPVHVAPVHVAAAVAVKATAGPVQVKASGSLGTVVAFALSQRGKPYVWGAAGPSAYDCSGLVMASYARIGVRLPHQSGGIAARGRVVPRSQLRPGDVLSWPGHVALFLGGNQMVAAPHSGTVVQVQKIYGTPRVIRIVG